MKGYYTQCIVYERVGNNVTPVRIRREWVDGEFKITECDSIPWPMLPSRAKTAGIDWSSSQIKAETRAQLIASGVIRLPGDGQVCLMLNG